MIRKIGNAFPKYLESVLHSYSLVFFGKANLFSIILLIVTFFDLYTGLAGLVAVITTNTAAYLIGLNQVQIRQGSYGFNALLVGLGLGIQFQPEPAFFVVLVFAALLTLFITVSLEGIFRKYTIPYLTFPFLLAIWAITLATRFYDALEISERGIYTINFMHRWGGLLFVDIYKWFSNLPIPETWVIYFKSIGAIFFQYNFIAGLIIAIGILIHSRISFLLSLVGFFTAYGFYTFIGANISELNYNFIGFNYILSAIAIGAFFVIPSAYSFLWVILLTPLISLVITSGGIVLDPLQLPLYSLAFNLVVAMFLYMMFIRSRFYEKPAITGVQLFSPEKNLYYQRNSQERFAHNKYFPFILPVMGEWTIMQGYEGEYTHKHDWRHALDFIITDEKENSHKGHGVAKEDYFCYGKPVIAPADAVVEEVLDGIEDNAIGDMNLNNNWGNTIILKHAEGLYTKLSHLKKNSFRVKKGERVRKGDILALVGNSGRSPEPHLHFQVQTTPFIGSKTMYYPLSHYIVNKDDEYLLNSYRVPRKNQRVSNIETQSLLANAFHFIPGQKINYEVFKSDNTKTIFHWEVMSNIFNQVYIYCHQTQSKAFLMNDGGIHYFTHFEGDKDTLLFYFYAAFYKVPLGFYKQLIITDRLPLNIMKTGVIKILQDFVAPFYLFLNAGYELVFTKKKEDFTKNEITIQSRFDLKLFKKTFRNAHFETTIEKNAIASFTIKEGQKTTQAKRIES